jgi:hypothetical protein
MGRESCKYLFSIIALPDYQKEDILQRINFVWFHKMGYGPEKDDC